MWGVTGAAYLRLHEPQYEDGVRTPRNMARSGRAKLPDALTVSSKLIWTRNNPHEHLTALAAIWGQFVSHDISYTLPLSGYEKVSNSIEILLIIWPLSFLFKLSTLNYILRMIICLF